MEDLKSLIREIPDFPKPGILFYDITTLLKDGSGFQRVMSLLKESSSGIECDLVLGIEARGFMFAPVIAYALGKGFVPVRKPKKLPGATLKKTYDLEYGKDSLEIHADAIRPGERVLVVDDVLATGGTASAVAGLIEMAGGTVAGYNFVIELDFLKGREKLTNHQIHSLLHY